MDPHIRTAGVEQACDTTTFYPQRPHAAFARDTGCTRRARPRCRYEPRNLPAQVRASSWVALLWICACRTSSGQELSAEQMSEVVTREQPALQKCYQTGLDKAPDEHEFKINAVLRIAPDGHVAEVELDESAIAGLRSCVTKAIRNWRFPKAQVETRAKLPLVFHPEVVHITKPAPRLQLPPGFRSPQQQQK